MFTSIWDDLKQQFNYGNMITRIVLVNIAVFVIINLILVFSGAGRDVTGVMRGDILQYVAINKDWMFNLTHPWVLLTNMIVHVGFWHILWNMLLLYWFGRIVGDLLGDRKILPLYFLGGLFGAFVYFIFANIMMDGPSYAYGASAAVMAVILAAGVIAPEYRMRLILIGEVPLKYIVAALLLIDLIGVGGMSNTGGHVAHLGGAAFGWFFATQLRQGNDLSVPVNNFIDRFINWVNSFNSAKKPGPRVAYKNPKAKNVKRSKSNAKSDPSSSSYQEQLDMILDKIKQTGYESLNETEKEFLFNASKKK